MTSNKGSIAQQRFNKVIRSADSPSLWNYTLSPGWTQEDIEVLRLSIMKWGLGSWQKICKSGCLPGKSASQLNLQAQRIIGQQSLGEFMGIHLDPREIWQINNQRQGREYVRKNGAIINTGNVQTKEERLLKHEENKKKFSLSQEQVDAIVVPVSSGSKCLVANLDKKNKLRKLKMTLAWMEERLKEIEKSPEYDPTLIPPPSPKKEKPVQIVVDPKQTSLKLTLKTNTIFANSKSPINLEEDVNSGDSSDNNKNVVAIPIRKKHVPLKPIPKPKRKKQKKRKDESEEEEEEEMSMEEEESDPFELDSDFEEDSKRKKKKPMLIEERIEEWI